MVWYGTGKLSPLTQSQPLMVTNSLIQIRLVQYSNHPNTGHLNTGFIWIPDIFVRFSNGLVHRYQNDHIYRSMPFEYRTIRQPDMFGPFENRTSPVFGWLLYCQWQSVFCRISWIWIEPHLGLYRSRFDEHGNFADSSRSCSRKGMTSSKADTVINKTYRLVLARYEVITGKTRLLYVKPCELLSERYDVIKGKDTVT